MRNESEHFFTPVPTFHVKLEGLGTIFMSKIKLFFFFHFLTNIQLDYKIVPLQLHVTTNNKIDIRSDSCNEI